MSAIDPRSVDWRHVRRARFDVRHHYRYTYYQPISRLEQRLVMTPPDRHVDQILLEHTFRVAGAGDTHTVAWEEDRFGNRVARVSVPSVAKAVTFESSYRVERASGRAAPTGRISRYLHPTALTAPDDRIRAAADQIRRETGGGSNASDNHKKGSSDGEATVQEALADRAHDWASHAIKYQLGVTGVQTPAAMALHLGGGVCQDYAHILLAALRLLGIPARYVSGHLLGEGVPHAWVEAFIRDPKDPDAPNTSDTPGAIQTIAYDPTHHRRAGLQYVTVAAGRDFADVSPTSGTFSGASPGLMTWGKHATLLEVE